MNKADPITRGDDYLAGIEIDILKKVKKVQRLNKDINQCLKEKKNCALVFSFFLGELIRDIDFIFGENDAAEQTYKMKNLKRRPNKNKI